MTTIKLSSDQHRLINGQLHDPFAVLGCHPIENKQDQITIFAPHVEQLLLENRPMQRIPDSDFFFLNAARDTLPQHYRLSAADKTGHEYEFYDPYSFAAQIPDFDLHLFAEGQHLHVYRHLGAQAIEIDGISGILFATWAPNAQRVSVIGNFNQWDGIRNPMRSRGSSGVWELFIPELEPGSVYKFELLNRETGQTCEKTDPYARQFEYRPKTAALTPAKDTFTWADQSWQSAREQLDWQHAPVSIYELHLGSWQRDENNEFLNYRELAKQLVDYVKPLGFTHIELLPVTEHPLDDSWGYQVTGYFAPTARFGSPDDFRYFVDYLHQHNIGVILDWVPAHFPRDEWALSNFDGAPLYEHADPKRGEHRDWGTLIFDFGRNEVKNFLISSAMYWIEEFHIDGIRVDAVASMLYLDYSREDGDWSPNIHGGNENLEAIEFIQHLNSAVGSHHPGVMMIAEESTSWPQVSRPTWLGGLGFSMKWNMGWMHDSLEYLSKDPVYRHFHHDKLTFGMLYCFSENFVLPFSHDEVVHGKGSMINKMPGDRWQKFANLRLLYTFQFTYPGKKLLFMGSEFAQFEEWNQAAALPWSYLDYHEHRGIQKSIADLNKTYRQTPALFGNDFDAEGFNWIDCHDSAQSVVVFERRSGEEFVIVVLNFTPIPRQNYRIGVPSDGIYQEIFNSDSEYYAGSNMGNQGTIQSEPSAWMNQPHSVTLTLPPLSGLILKPVTPTPTN